MSRAGAGRCVAVALMLLPLASRVILAQPQALPDERLASLAPPRAATAPSQIRRRLERLEWLIERKQWDEAAALALELAAEAPGVWVEQGDEAAAPLTARLHQLLVTLPDEGAAAYGRLADAAGAARLVAAVEDRDEAALMSVIDQYPGSAVALRGLWRHAEWALERADWRTAAGDWGRVDAALAKLAPSVVEELREQGVTPAAVACRLAVVAMRGGQLADARERLDEAARRGADEEDVATLRRELSDAATWPPPRPASLDWSQPGYDGQRSNHAPHRGAADDGADYAPLWTAALVTDDYADDQEVRRMLSRFNVTMPPTVFPVIVGDAVWWQDSIGLNVRPLDPPEGASHDADQPIFAWPEPGETAQRFAPGLQIKLPAYMVTATDNAVYASTHRALAPRGSLRTESRLVSVGADAGRRLRLRVSGDQGVTFAGPIVVRDSVLAVASCRMTDASLHVELAGYDAESGVLLWRTPLGAAGTPAAGQASEYPQIGLCAVEGVAVVSTNLGMTAAVRLVDGRPLWLRKYPRVLVRDDYGGVRYYAAYPQTPAVCGDMVVAAPLDCDHVMAWDLPTGEPRWSTPIPEANARVLGVDGERILLSGERAWALDAATGQVDPAWGENLWGGAGQGALLGDWLLWPTAGSVRIVNSDAGEPVGDSLELPDAGGANVIAACGGEYVVAAGRRRLTVFRRTKSNATQPASAEQPPADSSPDDSE